MKIGRRTGILIVCSALLLTALGATAQDISLPREMPSFNQAYSEGPGAWGDCPLGTLGCPDLVCTTGCLITAFSSVLAYYQVDVHVPAAFSCTGEARTGMDPGIFNDWLRSQEGYGHCAQDPVGNCCLDWSSLPNQISIETHVNRSDVGLNPVASVVIDHALRQGYPVIAGVHWGATCNGGTTQSEDCHWVILTGRRGDDYTIVDPYNANPASPFGIETTLSAGVHGNYIIDRFVVVTGALAERTDLSISLDPNRRQIPSGRTMTFTARTTSSSAVVPYVRVTSPSGDVRYASTGSNGSVALQDTWTSFRSDPVLWSDEWQWSIVHSADEAGRWTWDVWVEDPEEPGVQLAVQQIIYVVEARAGQSFGGTLLGVLFIAALAAGAFFLALQGRSGN